MPCEKGAFQNPSADDFNGVTLYREIVGSLIYVMTGTRPDLCFVVTKLPQCLSNPKTSHYAIAKQTLRYLKGTKSHKLRYTKQANDQFKILGFSDSDWANSEDRYSISGIAFKFGDSQLISWKSKKQSTVALSTCEAEYIALSLAVQEAKFLRQLLGDMTCDNVKFVDVYVDNQSVIALAKNSVHHQRSKHIDIKYHFVRHEVQSANIKLEYVPTELNLADVFTKALSSKRIQKLMKF